MAEPAAERCDVEDAFGGFVVRCGDAAGILRARRKRAAWGEDEPRRRWQGAGAHGSAKTLHGLARAVRRGPANRKAQAFLTAKAMNLTKLAVVMGLICSPLENRPASMTPTPA